MNSFYFFNFFSKAGHPGLRRHPNYRKLWVIDDPADPTKCETFNLLNEGKVSRVNDGLMKLFGMFFQFFKSDF